MLISMRNLPFITIIFFFSLELNAQKEEPAYTQVVTRLTDLYNRNNYDSIFTLFSPEMKKALPLAKTIAFFEATKREAGKILSAKFEGYESSYASYKTECYRRLYSTLISIDKNNRINGLYIQPYTASNLPDLTRNSTPLMLPFDSAWSVMWGGDTKDLNYHVEVPVQKHAFDFTIKDSLQKSYKRDSKTNEDYYAFGKNIIAPCDAFVVQVIDGIKDNEPGRVNPMFVTGNTVILKTDKAEYLLFAHFKKHSIKVKEGQKLKQGELLGLCGNSGNSSEPHLHFHIQNVEDINTADGVKCYFESIRVNGISRSDYSPVKGERIENIKK
jgi:murein DD-endopeptidase MepM/ murein hydrolase activator NlpD